MGEAAFSNVPRLVNKWDGYSSTEIGAKASVTCLAGN